jgi:hypothetical protein
MYHLSTLLATAILASTALCAPAPEKKTRDVIHEIYGPIEDWTPIRLIDVYPNALVDGLPVNDSVIYSYGNLHPSSPLLYRYENGKKIYSSISALLVL